MSRGWAGAHPTRLGERLEVVPELLRFCERQQLLQALILDLADPLARDVERPPDLVERARMLAVEAVAQLEHRPLAARDRARRAASVPSGRSCSASRRREAASESSAPCRQAHAQPPDGSTRSRKSRTDRKSTRLNSSHGSNTY